MKHYVKKFIKIFLITILVAAIALGVILVGAVMGWWGGGNDQLSVIKDINRNTVILYTDPDTGEQAELQTVNISENREWVSIDEIPKNLQNAFIAIEDERFREHNGCDIPRTLKATFTWFGNKLMHKNEVSLGGSTITQQLIKNATGNNDQTPWRKITEISSAVSLEKSLSKDEILEAYLNWIYLAHGCNGVQTASRVYFDKDVKDLTLTECAAIAGITQNPTAYDPINNPDNNKRRRKLVLDKMYQLGYIGAEEYAKACEEDLKISNTKNDKKTAMTTTSYFADQVIRDVIQDLQRANYTKELAERLVYSGGLTIYSTYNPKIQTEVEKYYENAKNFPGNGVQSAITIMDVQTGEIVGIAGGVGEKTGSLTLNRASQSPRQPGSTIKPLSAYAPAIESGLITAGSIFDDKATSYDGWVPRNYDYSYRGKVDVRTAVRKSLNTTPVEIVSKMGTQKSYDFLTNKFGLTTLVSSESGSNGTYTDIGLAQLALGGLTKGAKTTEMAAAYASFANGGIYHRPCSYTKVVDKDGNVLLENDKGSRIMKESTAYIMTQLLKEVVTSGTGVGASVDGVSYTAGKTGTTSENNDRWFIGYTPYYVAAIWYGYDTPKEIQESSNPCIPVFRTLMNKAHSQLKDKSRTMSQPNGVVNVSFCAYTGDRATSSCPSMSYWCATENIPKYCNGSHSGSIKNTTAGEAVSSARNEKSDDEDKTDTSAETESTTGGTTGTTSGNRGNTSGGTTSGNQGTVSSGTGANGTTPSGGATGGGTTGGGTTGGGTSGGSASASGGTSVGTSSHAE